MIRYAVSKDQLEQLIETERPGWLARAKERLDIFANLGYYKEASSIWSEVKVVYMRLQYDKCAYCERKLESEKYGAVEHDMEHFRPKKKARPWKLPKSLQQAGIVLTEPETGTADPGYYLLAYHPLNYCTSCKTCNTRLKSDYFPIEGPRNATGTDPVQLCSEKPLLVNPVGDFDDDPATLIAFHGLSPMACCDTDDYKHHRGLVTIAFFHLDDLGRKNLFRERAKIITDLYAFLELAENATNPDKKKRWERLVENWTKPSEPHSNCACCYRDLYKKDRGLAEELSILAENYLSTISP